MTMRRFEAVPNYPGISRILILNEKSGKWEEPERGNKFLVCKYEKDGDGKSGKARKTFSSFAGAMEFRRARETPVTRESQTAKEVADSSNAMTFRKLVEIWKADFLPNKELPTQIRYKSYLQHLEFFNDMVIEQIEPTTIDKWIAALKKPEYLKRFHSTRCTYKHEYSILKGILNFYIPRFNRNYRLPFISEHLKSLKVKEKPKVSKDLTVEQFKLFLESLKTAVFGTKWEVLYYLSLMQYAIYGRVQDAAALHYEDFDFGRNKIMINKKVQWMRAKGYEDRIVDGSKANGGKELPMSDLAKRVFNQLVLRFGVRSGPLFYIDGGVIPYRVIEYRYSKALKDAGLPFSATHILRHASLTEHYETCKDLLQTQKMAGHTDLKSTSRYAKVRDERLAQTQKELDLKLVSLLP